MRWVRGVNPFVRNLLILVLIALAVVLLNQEVALATVSMIVRFAFFIAIGVAIYFLWRDFGRREITLWPARSQWAFYLAGALLLVDVGWWIVSHPTGRDALASIVVGAVALFVGVRTWREQQRYA